MLSKIVYRFCVHFGLSTPRQLRRLFLRVFMASGMARKLMTRKGGCHHGDCALACCQACPWLVKKEEKWFCLDWEHVPDECRRFPLDEKELQIMNAECEKLGLNTRCGFYWVDKKSSLDEDVLLRQDNCGMRQ